MRWENVSGIKLNVGAWGWRAGSITPWKLKAGRIKDKNMNTWAPSIGYSWVGADIKYSRSLCFQSFISCSWTQIYKVVSWTGTTLVRTSQCPDNRAERLGPLGLHKHSEVYNFGSWKKIYLLISNYLNFFININNKLMLAWLEQKSGIISTHPKN